jgi:hypothetical protein
MIDISKNKCVVAIITVERDMVAPLRVDQVADLKDVRILPPELSERVSVGVQKKRSDRVPRPHRQLWPRGRIGVASTSNCTPDRRH